MTPHNPPKKRKTKKKYYFHQGVVRSDKIALSSRCNLVTDRHFTKIMQQNQPNNTGNLLAHPHDCLYFIYLVPKQ
jgi:hypothetical protein